MPETENVRKRVCLKESERRRRKKECRAVSMRSSHSLRERKKLNLNKTNMVASQWSRDKALAWRAPW
jgi:hypothetical protein